MLSRVDRQQLGVTSHEVSSSGLPRGFAAPSVRKRKLKPADVSILYFEHAGNAVTIHNMTLDEHGNLRDAPAGYRDFFVRETDRLLGFAD